MSVKPSKYGKNAQKSPLAILAPTKTDLLGTELSQPDIAVKRKIETTLVIQLQSDTPNVVCQIVAAGSLALPPSAVH
jgi:hypothetical protein